MKLAPLMTLLSAAAVILLLDSPSPAQPDKSGKDSTSEVNVVLRISRKLISELTTKKSQRADPVYLCIDDSEFVGTAWTDALFSIQFDASAKESTFVLQLKGKTTSRTVSEQPWVKILGSARMDFTVRKRVIFDGTKYRGDPSDADAIFRSQVDDIVAPPGLIGSIIKLIAAKEVRLKEPVVAGIAFEDGKTKLIEQFDKEAARLLDELNQVSPLQETVKILYPETRDWIFYHSTTPTHLVIGFGPRDRRVPELPVTEKTNAPMEMWIRSKKETQAMLRIFKIWKDAGKQLDTMLPPELAKVIKPGDGFKTQFVKEWVVIQLGVGGTKDTKEKSEKEGPSLVWQPFDLNSSSGPLADPVVPVQPPARKEVPPSSAPVIWRPAGNAPKTTPGAGDAGGTPLQIEWRPALPLGGQSLPPTVTEKKPLFGPWRK